MIARIANDFISLVKSNKFFRKTARLYVVTGSILFFLFGIVTIWAISKSTIAHINVTEQKMLGQSCNTADLILRDIHSIADGEFSANTAIWDAMTGPYSVTVSQNVQSAFNDIMASSKLIDSVYVVNAKYDTVYSTETGIKGMRNFYDKDIIEYLSQAPPKSDIYFPRSVDLAFAGNSTVHKNYITSVYRNSADCALVINIAQEKFQNIVNLASDNSEYQTAVIDSDGYIISHTTPEYFAKNATDDDTFNDIFTKLQNYGAGSGSFRYRGYTVNFTRSDILGYEYISYAKPRVLLGGLANLVIYLILFTALLLVLYFVCSILASLNTYSLFNGLKKNIYSLVNKSDDELSGDETENITKILKEVKESYASMETVRYQYMNSKQNDTLKRILTGTFAYLQEDMEKCEITFPYSGFAVIIMNIDNASKMDSDTIYMIKYAVMNMGKEIFESNSKAYAAEINDQDIVFILNYESNGFIKESVDRLNSYMLKFFNATASAAYDTGVSDSIEDISVLYHNAKHAVPYRLVKGHASVIACDDIADIDNSVSSYPQDLEDEILKKIASQDDEALKRNVHSFIELFGHTSYNMIMLFANRLLMAVNQFFIRTNISEGSDNVINIQNIISNIETLDELEAYILSTCRNAMLKFSSAKFDSKKEMMVKKVLEYIKANYTDPNLSIDMIAGEINRSANYTRSIFKQSQGISISDYIAKMRFDEVCRLLVETNMTAQEIGAKLGLNSGSYFYTSFKKHTGYTPDQYRKIHKQ